MRLSIEMESEDWLSLLCFNQAGMDIATKNMSENPLLYSKLARINNELLQKVSLKLPEGELQRIVQMDKAEDPTPPQPEPKKRL